MLVLTLSFNRRSSSTANRIYFIHSGRHAIVRIRFTGLNIINKTSLVLKLMNTAGLAVLQTHLTEDSAESFTTSFTPPSAPFRFQLSGQTKEGFTFQRLTHNTIQAKSAVLRFIPREDHFRLQPRKRSFVLLEFYNVGPAEWFHIKVHDTRGFARSVFRDTRFVRQGTQTAIFLWLWPTAGKYQKGKTDIVIVSVRGRSSNKVSTAIVRMLMT